jgi:hypothetical protein
MDKYQCHQKNNLFSGNAKNLSFAACEPFFTGYAKLSLLTRTAVVIDMAAKRG